MSHSTQYHLSVECWCFQDPNSVSYCIMQLALHPLKYIKLTTLFNAVQTSCDVSGRIDAVPRLDGCFLILIQLPIKQPGGKRRQTMPGAHLQIYGLAVASCCAQRDN